MSRKVTIQDVAERAGVSASTVSRTLHNHPKITQETKHRVLVAAESLHYRSNLYPDSSNSAKLIGVILPNSEQELFRHPFFTAVLRGVSIAAQAAGYLVTFGFAQTPNQKMELLRSYLDTRSVRGFVLLRAYQNDPCIDELIERDEPFCVIGRPEASREVLWVDNDNFHAAYDAVNRLIESGHKSIAFVGGPQIMNVTRDRLEGYRMALTNRGIQFESGLVGFADSFGEPGGAQAMRQILDRGVPDAVLASDDYLALGALKTAREYGLRELECVGFNNTEWGPGIFPPFSSVEIYPEQLGLHAARLIIDKLEHVEREERSVIVPTRLVARGSLTTPAEDAK